jgi:hypothetical protein
VRAAVGFVEGDDGSFLIAATEPSTNWALNLLADPNCKVTLEDASFAATADTVDDATQRNRAVAALILKYGTPAERLGRGPVFRVRRVDQPT